MQLLDNFEMMGLINELNGWIMIKIEINMETIMHRSSIVLLQIHDRVWPYKSLSHPKIMSKI